MRKHLLSFAAIAAFFVPGASAQEQTPPTPKSPFHKGNVTIGTRIGLAELSGGSTLDGKSGFQYNVSLSPSAGYFVTDNLLVSANLTGGVNGSTLWGKYSGKHVGGGLAARYYFGRAMNSNGEVNRFRLYAEAGAIFSQGWGKTETLTGATARSAAYGIDFRGGAGFNYLITDRIAFESGLSYNRNLYNSGNLSYQSNVQLELGLRIFLSRGK